MSVNKRKHILFISAWFPTTVNRYNGDFVQRHAKAVSLMNDVTVIHCIGVDDLEKAYTEHHKDGEQYQEFIYYFPKSKLRLINLIRKTWAYHRLAKQVKPYDLIHANVFYYSILWVFLQRLFGGKKVVLSEHNTIYISSSSPKGMLYRFNRSFSKLIERILPVSKSLQHAMMDKGIANKYVVVPNVIDTSVFRIKKKHSNKCCSFVHISSLNFEQKNIQGHLEAIKVLSKKRTNFHFSFYGLGNDKDRRQIIRFIKLNNLKDFVSLHGTLDQTRVAEVMAASDCFVLFSNEESFSCVKFESFSVGTPVIASNLEPLQEWFPTDFGFLVEKGNVHQLVKAMIKVIDGHSFAESEVMHKYVENRFSPKVIASHFEQVYQRILK